MENSNLEYFPNIHLMIKKKKWKNQKIFYHFEKCQSTLEKKLPIEKNSLDPNFCCWRKCQSTLERKLPIEKNFLDPIFFCWRSFWWSRSFCWGICFVEVEVEYFSKNSKYGDPWSKKMWKKVNYLLPFRRKYQRKKLWFQYMEIIPTPGNFFHDLDFLQFQEKVVKIHDRKKSERSPFILQSWKNKIKSEISPRGRKKTTRGV